MTGEISGFEPQTAVSSGSCERFATAACVLHEPRLRKVYAMTTQDILAKVASQEISPDDAVKLIAAINGNGKGRQKLSYKVSDKGAVSVYGLGRFPTTLYVEQWERLDSDEERQTRQDFIKANAASLTRKN